MLQRSSSHSPVPTNPPLQITKGKVHGSIDVRLSVMSINKKAQRIDLDTEDNIYHLKVTFLRTECCGYQPGRGGQGRSIVAEGSS